MPDRGESKETRHLLSLGERQGGDEIWRRIVIDSSVDIDNTVDIEMPKVVDADQQRKAIRDAARRVFTTRGIESTGLAHVAEAAGMGRSSIYHYYTDKDSLIRDLAKDLLDREEEMFEGALRREGPPLQRILALFDELTAVCDAWVAIGTMVMDLRRLDPTRFRGFFRRIRRELAQLIVEGQNRGEIASTLKPEAVAAVLIGMIDGLLFQKLIDPGALKGRSSYDAMRDAIRQTLQPSRGRSRP